MASLLVFASGVKILSESYVIFHIIGLAAAWYPIDS